MLCIFFCFTKMPIFAVGVLKLKTPSQYKQDMQIGCKSCFACKRCQE